MKSFLSRLGIYGYTPSHERAMLASILTGTPVLFIGNIGEAKTKAAEMFAKLLGEPFQKIAADKAQFEDMVGFPSPKSLAEGEVEYVRTRLSIWEKRFVLIDEISRCNPQMQNKFLEIVLDRQLMGLPTDIKWVWATMNPQDYPGSQPLDEALAGRMGYVLQVKRVVEQSDHVIEQVVASRSATQTPALSHWTSEARNYTNTVEPTLQEELREVMYRAGEIYTGLEDHWTMTISKYVASFGKTLESTAKLFLDGRRMVMIKNNILSNIAIQTVMNGHALNLLELKALCAEVLPLSIPWLATGISSNFDEQKFKAAHKIATAQLDSSDSLVYRIVTEQDRLRKVKLFLENRTSIPATEAASLIASIYDPVKVSGTADDLWQEKARVFALQLAFLQLAVTLKDVPGEVISIAARNYPISFDKHLSGDMRTSSCVRVTTSTYDEMQTIIALYREAMAYTDPVQIAAAYFAFQSERITCTPSDIHDRLAYAREALATMAAELQAFLPGKVTHVHSNGVIPALQDPLPQADPGSGELEESLGQSGQLAIVI